MKLPSRLKSFDTLSIFFLAGWHWIVFLSATLGFQAFGSGSIEGLFFPLRVELARALAEGRLLLWNTALQ